MAPGISGQNETPHTTGAGWSLFDLACYPFLPGIQEWLKSEGLTLELLARDPLHAGARGLGLERLETSLRGETLNLPGPTTEREMRELLISYLWARVLLAGLVGLAGKPRKPRGRKVAGSKTPDRVEAVGQEAGKDKLEEGGDGKMEAKPEPTLEPAPEKDQGAGLAGNARLGELAVRYFALSEAIAMQNRLNRNVESEPRRLVEMARGLGLRVRRADGPARHRPAGHGTTLRLVPIKEADGAISDLELNLSMDDGTGGRSLNQDEAIETFQLFFGDYLRAASPMRDANWKLVNQDLQRGWVTLSQRRLLRLIREVVRERLEHNLPSIEDPSLLADIDPALKRLGRILAARQARAASEGVGKLSLTKAPPCVQSLLGQLSGGVNVPHLGRFTLTAFLHAVGMDEKQIMALHATAPDFSADIAQYQVEHILGRISPTEYDTPACDHLKTNGLCVDPDGLCERVNHPLEYYRVMSEDEKAPGVRLERILLATLLDGRPQVAAMKSLFGKNKESFVKLLLQPSAKEPSAATLVRARDSPSQPFRFKVRVVRFQGVWRRESNPLSGHDESLTFGIARLADDSGEMTSAAIMDWQVGRALAPLAGSRKGVELLGQAQVLELDEGRRQWRLHCIGLAPAARAVVDPD